MLPTTPLGQTLPNPTLRRVKSDLAQSTHSRQSASEAPISSKATPSPPHRLDVAHSRRRACIECQRRKIRCDGNKPACGPCVARGGEPCDFNLPDRENRIASLETKIRMLEREIRLVDGSGLNPAEFRARLMRRINNMFPENILRSRPLPPVVPIFPLTGNVTGPLPERSIQLGYLAGGYGFSVSRAEIDAAAFSWDPRTQPSPALTLLLVRCFLPFRRIFHLNIDPHVLLARLQLGENDPAAPLPALTSTMVLVACRLVGGSLARYENKLLERTRRDLEQALAYADRLDDFLWASTVLGMYYGHTLRFLEAHLFYGGTVRFAVALGIHTEEPSEQMLLSKVLSSAQRRKELQTLWHSIHVTDLWLTNACAFTVVNGPASSVPVEHMASMNNVYNIISLSPKILEFSDPAELRSYAYVLYCSIQSFCSRYRNSKTKPAQPPRSGEFWSEYEKLSTVLSALRLGPLPLQSTLGLAEFEIISPCNPDTLYLRVLINVSVLLLYDVLAQDGDQAAHTESVNAARELAKLARMMRAAGRSTHGPQGTHELQTPYIMVIPFFIATELFVRELGRPVISRDSEMMPPPPPPPPAGNSSVTPRHIEWTMPFTAADRAAAASDLEAVVNVTTDMMRFYPHWVPGMIRMYEVLFSAEPSFLFI